MCVETKKQQAGEISIDEMDPTFLFIWKGTRDGQHAVTFSPSSSAKRYPSPVEPVLP